MVRLATLVAGLVLGAGTAPAPGTFVDAVGDSGTAPDIVKVAAGTDAQGRATLTVSFATPFAAASSLLVYVNADKNATGGPYGAEYLVTEPQSRQPTVSAWSGGAWTATGAVPAVTVAPDGMSVAVAVDLSALGGTSGFDFVVQSLDGDGGPGHADTALGIWSKQAPLGLTILASSATPPRAGGIWVATVTAASRDASADQGAVACSGSSGRTRLVLSRRKVLSVRSGRISAICVFAVPKTLKGKRLQAKMTVTLGGQSATQSFAATAK